jgi:cytochrome c
MRRVLIICLAVTVFAACNSNSESKPAETTETPEKKEEPAVVDITKNPDYQKGLDLIAKSDCFTCHSVAEKINGPAYRDVANKYAGMADTIVSHLAQKIISGGSGVWGEIPMIPHPALSKEDAEAMVKYVLLLKQ